MWKRSLPLDSKQMGVFLSDGEEFILFDEPTIVDAAKQLAKRILEVEGEHSLVSEVRVHARRLALGGIALGVAVSVTALVLPTMPLNSQISVGGVTDIATALVLRYL